MDEFNAVFKHHVEAKESRPFQCHKTDRKPGRGADNQSEGGTDFSPDLQRLINDCVDNQLINVCWRKQNVQKQESFHKKGRQLIACFLPTFIIDSCF